MEGHGECPDWISDYVIGVLKSPTWVAPISEFIDEHCRIFEDTEEYEHYHNQCHLDFRQLVDSLLAAHLMDVSVTPEQFDRFCEGGLSSNSSLHRTLVEQLLAVEDFLTFKAMMTKHNAQLDREVVCHDVDDESPDASARDLASSVIANSMCQAQNATGEGWQLYEDQLDLLMSPRHGGEDEEGLDSLQRCEEAALEQAIALSLQLEEERLRQLEAGDGNLSEAPLSEAGAYNEPFPPVPVQYALPPSAGFMSAPLMPRPVVTPSPAVVPATTEVPHMVIMEPMARRAWGFTSAPIMYAYQPPPEPGCAPVPAPPPPPPPPPAQVPGIGPMRTLGFTSSPLCFVPPRAKQADFMMTNQSALSGVSNLSFPNNYPEYAALEGQAPQTAVEGMRSNLQAWRMNSVMASPQMSPHLSPRMSEVGLAAARPSRRGSLGLMATGQSLQLSGPSFEEKAARQEHLRRQRDRLIQKRKMELEQQVSNFSQLSHSYPPAPDSGPEERSAAGRRLVAELTPGAVVASAESPPLADPRAAAEKMRQALTLQLRASLMKTMVSDAKVLDHQITDLESLRCPM